MATRSATGACPPPSAWKTFALGLQVQGAHRLLGRWLCSTGLLFIEAIQLRVKDLDFPQLAPIMREEKGAKGRVIMVPHSPLPELRCPMG